MRSEEAEEVDLVWCGVVCFVSFLCVYVAPVACWKTADSHISLWTFFIFIPPPPSRPAKLIQLL